MNDLANQHLRVTIADTGSLLAIENHLADEAYHFAADTFAVESNQGRFSNDTTRPSGLTPTPDGLIFHFAFAQVTLDLIYLFGQRGLPGRNAMPLVAVRPTTASAVMIFTNGGCRYMTTPSSTPPKITYAYVTGNVTLTQSTQLHVHIDQPPDALQQVLYTHSGFPWMGIIALAYDPALACWVAEVKPGARAAIQENELIYVWAVGCDGLQSDYYPVKVGWDFAG